MNIYIFQYPGDVEQAHAVVVAPYERIAREAVVAAIRKAWFAEGDDAEDGAESVAEMVGGLLLVEVKPVPTHGAEVVFHDLGVH